MGDRLVIKILNRRGKLLAASYQHWAGENYAYFEQRLMDAKARIIGDRSFFRSSKQAVQALMEALTTDVALVHPGLATTWWLNGTTQAQCNATRRFQRRHPEYPTGESRCDGYISMDADVVASWTSWADMLLVR